VRISRTARVVIAAALVSIAPIRAALAQTASAAEVDRAELALEIDPGETGLDPADIRAAVERELELPTVLSTSSSPAVLSIRGTGDLKVAMSFRQANGRHVEREITIPEERARALETIGLLAVNLVRNEAADVVAAMLKKQRTAEVPAAPPALPVVEAPRRFEASPLVPPPPLPPAEPTPCKRRDGYHFVTWGADLAPSVGTSRWERPRTVRRLSLELAGGNAEAVHGLGISPLVHMTSDFVCGAEISTIGNITGGPVEGAQIAGVFNLAQGDVKGAQFGLVNVSSGVVHGVQFGLVNVADDSDLSIGLVNILRKGRIGVDAFGAETGFTSLALKNGGKHWHAFYGITYRGGDRDLRFGYALGLGAHLTTPSRVVFVDIDALAFALSHDAGSLPDRKGGWLAEGRAVVGVRPVPHVSIYAGPTYNAYITQDIGSDPPFQSHLVASAASRSFAYSRWPGFSIGLQVMSGD